MLDGLKKAFTSLAEHFSTTQLSSSEIKKILEDFKFQLAANDVSIEAAERLSELIEERLRTLKVHRFSDRDAAIKQVMIDSLSSILIEANPKSLLNSVIAKKSSNAAPYIILFVGPNGGGKTTTVAKMAHFFKKSGLVPVIACSDTFRAAAIEQLKKLADKIGVRTVSQVYGSDPAAVAIDAINSARASGAHVVLIDTAGRTEIDRNLLEEMRKIKRVTMPDSVVYVGDSLTGNVALEQARQFHSYVGIDYVILTKFDSDTRGGSAISICYAIGKPILFIGVGQGLDDLIPFTKDFLISRLFA
ncbi:MAG: signal recognition particle-docking protein FtsY [Nitrososphaerota archaeon]